MDPRLITYIVIPIAVLTTMTLARKLRNKLAKPDVKENVQTPGRFERINLWVIRIIGVFTGLFTLLGAIAGEMEMTLVFLVLTLVFMGAVWLIKREYNMTYQENDEFFILHSKGKEYKVYYENIVDWLPGLNEIQLLDKTREEGDYVRVNVSIFHPEILLKQLVEMTFEGKFHNVGYFHQDQDPHREAELLSFLEQHDYGHLMEKAQTE